jgi:hypothetical protein
MMCIWGSLSSDRKAAFGRPSLLWGNLERETESFELMRCLGAGALAKECAITHNCIASGDINLAVANLSVVDKNWFQ